ncbi:sugar transporter [Nesidiocoris tenuis]|nr:sugar transporter [Nesidiocoris tenuis]
MTIYAGMVVGWISPVSIALRSHDSPVGIMDKIDIAILATCANYFEIFGSLFYGFLAKNYGRKIGLLCVGIPSAVGGVFLTFATSRATLFVGRITTGFASIGGINLAPMYVSETVHESIRGMLMSSWTFQAGVLLSYTFGKLLSYQGFNSIMIAIPALTSMMVIWLPETPYFLAVQGRHEDALKAILWFRNNDERIARLEMENIKPRDEKTLTLLQTLRTSVTRKALLISVTAVALQTLSGIHGILNYAAIIFEEAGSPFSPEDSSILVGILIVVSSLISTVVIDKIGRKPLLYASFTLCGITMAVLSAFLYLRKIGLDVGHLGWVPVASIGTFVSAYGLGLGVVPSILTNEIAPVSIKPVVSSLVGASAMVLVILVVQSFPFLDDYLGLYSCFTLPAIFNFIGILFTRCLVPETKGKTLTEIANELGRKGKANVVESKPEEDPMI